MKKEKKMTELEYCIYLGLKIRGLRELKGISQRTLGEKVGLTKQTISKIEHGKSLPNAYCLFQMIEALNGNVEDFLPSNVKCDSNELKNLLIEKVKNLEYSWETLNVLLYLIEKINLK